MTKVGPWFHAGEFCKVKLIDWFLLCPPSLPYKKHSGRTVHFSKLRLCMRMVFLLAVFGDSNAQNRLQILRCSNIFVHINLIPKVWVDIISRPQLSDCLIAELCGLFPHFIATWLTFLPFCFNLVIHTIILRLTFNNSFADLSV